MIKEVNCMNCMVGRFKEDLCDGKMCEALKEIGKSEDFVDIIMLAKEIVRCKDCKWHINGHLCKQLSQYGSIETPQSFYCGFGERRKP